MVIHFDRLRIRAFRTITARDTHTNTDAPISMRFLPHLLIVLIPLAISIWAFVVSLSGYDAASLLPPPHIHLTAAMYQPFENAIKQAVIAHQIMTVFTVIMIVMLAVFERKMLPAVERTSLWVRMRERRLTR